jgi:cyclohexanecarboxyl-CoA dehydrogenase
MEFKFSKKEELWQWAVREFAEGDLAKQELMTLDYVPADLLKKMGELGFFSLKVPEEYGGKPGTWVMMGILAEEIAKTNIPIAYVTMVAYEVSLSLARYGTDEAKKEWLRGFVNGTRKGCISLNEPDSGVDVGAIRTEAIREQDSYFIKGEKSPVSFGTQADAALLFAKTVPERRAIGITAFLVPLNLSGITKSTIKNMGLFPIAPCSFTMDSVCIPAKYRIGDEGEGFSLLTNMGFSSDFHQIISGLISLGAAQTAMRLAITYSKQRVAFGRPIAQFEAISEKIAEDATLIEAARWLCYRTLALKDQGLSNAKEAAMCGWWCPKVAFQMIENALLIHGHTGYSDDLPLQQMLRDIVAFEMIAGTEQILKQIIAQKLIGSIAVPDNLSNQFSNY